MALLVVSGAGCEVEPPDPCKDLPVALNDMPNLYKLIGDMEEASLVDYFGHRCGSDWALSYAARSADSSAVAVSISGTVLTTVAVDEADSLRVVVTATDTAGNSAVHAFYVWTEYPNRAPIVVEPIDDVSVGLDQFNNLGSVQENFDDPDGDSLRYTARSADYSIAGVSFAPNGGRVTVTGIGIGSTTITITVNDSIARLDKLDTTPYYTSLSFGVTVTGG